MEVPSIDRVTRQRNIQLQRQLDVKLQILCEEYRMIKQDQEKNDDEIEEFCESLHHTAPGLHGYSQPNTKAMNIKNPTLLRKIVQWDSTSGNPKKYHRCNSNCETHGKNPWKLSQELIRQASSEGAVPKTSPTKEPPKKNSFFNKQIVLDAQRRSFVSKDISKSLALLESPKSQASTTQSLFSKVNTLTSTSQGFKRSLKPKYGREAFSAQERSARNDILSRFDTIFISGVRVGVPVPSQLPVTLIDNGEPDSLFDPTEIKHASTANVRFTASGNSVRRHRSAAASTGRYLQIDTQPSGGAGRGIRGVRSASASHQRAVVAHTQEEADLLRRLRQEDLNHGHQSEPWRKQRAKTAPASFELKQRAVAAPRQQLVGILAEIEWRKACIRTMLNQSRQLKHTVRTLTPFPLDDSDSLSDSLKFEFSAIT